MRGHKHYLKYTAVSSIQQLMFSGPRWINRQQQKHKALRRGDKLNLLYFLFITITWSSLHIPNKQMRMPWGTFCYVVQIQFPNAYGLLNHQPLQSYHVNGTVNVCFLENKYSSAMNIFIHINKCCISNTTRTRHFSVQ